MRNRPIYAPNDPEYAKELAALARMVTFARQTASDLNVGMPTYCLEMALAAILEELEVRGVDLNALTKKDSFGIPEAFH